MATNEKLIFDVFNEMKEYKTALAKYLIVDDEEDDDEVDFRILGDLLIKNFPWPIGIELRRLFSATMRELDRQRLDHIFKTIERTMQFLSFVMIAQMWKDKIEKGFDVPDALKNDFANRFSVLSMGNYTWLIRTIGSFYQKEGLEWFMPEMNEKLNKKFFNSLDFWVPERNEIGHYQINLTQEEIEKRCTEYEEKLTDILKHISFLAKYKLVSVRNIKVVKNRMHNAEFHHVIDLLNSSDSDFKAKEINEGKFVESNAILIMRSIKSIDEYMNLSPFVIDTHSEILDSKEKFDIKKDIFLYTKFRNDQIMYVGTEVTEKVNLKALSNYDNLVEEYKNMVETLTN